MTRWDRLVWTWRRLKRMTPWETAYRVIEQLKRSLDRMGRRGWASFGFPGRVSGTPGLNRDGSEGAGFRASLAEAAGGAIAGRFAFFDQPWPRPVAVGKPWWDSDFWLVDPISKGLWPGAATSAFDVAYRHDPARGDVKFVWEFNRLQFLPPLALQAALADDAGMAAQVFDILRGWMRANPPCRGVNWTSAIEAASRIVSLLAVLAFVQPSGEDEGAVRSFLHAHIHWIVRYPSRFSSANNHRVAELTALFLASICAPGLPGSERRLRRARDGLEREMLRQFHADGFGAEQSTAYAAYSLEWFTLAGVAGDAAGHPFSTAFKDRARLALDHLRWLTDEAGHTTRIGDGDDSRVFALTQAPEPRYVVSVTAMAARWLGEPEPSSDLRDTVLRDLLAKRTPQATAPTGVRTFAHGGLTVWRRPRPDGALLAAFDHGPLGHLSIAAHGHADALAVWLHWGDEAVFADPGTHLYHAPGDTRAVLRGTRAHNTLAIAGRDQSRIVGPFAWSDHARARLIRSSDHEVEAEHDGYRRRFGVVHRRRVQVGDYGIVIEDRVLGRAKAQRLPWSLGFTLAPGVAATVNGERAELRTFTGRRLTMTRALEGPDWALVETPYAPAFGSIGSTLRLEISGFLGPDHLVARTRIVLEPGAVHQERPT